MLSLDNYKLSISYLLSTITMEINDIISKFLNITKEFSGIKSVILFGSYAKNNQTKTSDIDIAISGEYDYFTLIDKIKDEINTLKRFDIVNYDEIVSKSFKKEIDTHGRILYKI